ncbi:MAG: hypothetical protein V7K41_05850 [Nostoc sp.]|uniref:hypothetical protein n=1 Tax=Nostoc sp. TaxID=1180 RepID=UPI002FFC9865
MKQSPRKFPESAIAYIGRTYAKYLSNSDFSVPRQLLQVGEPAQRTGFSVPLRFVIP